MTEVQLPEPDYPYYNERPASPSLVDWAVVLVGVALGFAALTRPVPLLFDILPRPAYAIFSAIAFAAIPLAALYWRSKGHVGALFNGWKWSYLGWGLLFGILNLIFTAVIGGIAVNLLDLTSNATTAGLAEGGPDHGALYFYSRTGIQLFGEEVLTIFPFLFLLWLGVQKLGMARRAAVILAWIVSALFFGAMHLPTYGWNVLQALLLIGPVRLVLTLAYMKTKSIWTSTIAHVFNDWAMFTATMVLGSLAAAST